MLPLRESKGGRERRSLTASRPAGGAPGRSSIAPASGAAHAAKGRICPLELTGDTMTVAMVDPREVADPRAKVSVGPPPPAVSAIEEIIGVGLGVGASDIHIEPQRSGVVVRYRLDGSLKRRNEPFAGELAKGIVSRFISSKSTIDEV